MRPCSRFVAILVCGLLLGLACATGPGGTADPASPVLQPAIQVENSSGAAGHYLWSYWQVYVDPATLESEIVSVRQAGGHLNVLQFLEQGPCTNCFKLAGITPNPDGTFNVIVSIKHPFANKNLTGFDVRGIAMFNGSHVFPESGLITSDRTKGEGEIVNADGFTTLYNPTTIGHGFEGYIKGKLATTTAPSSTLNGFKRFITNNPANARNAFYADDEIVVSYQIDMPDPPNPWVFGYAVDASWTPPVNKPVDDPMTDFGPDANCPEAWKVVVQDLGPGMQPSGGPTELQIDVYDWQGKDTAHPVIVECPELFDGEVQATWKEDSAGFTRYEAEIENIKLAGVGEYLCLITKEASENDPSNKSWLDLTAYQTLSVDVAGVPTNPVDVTPPWLNFSPMDVCVEGDYAYTAGDKNGLHIFDISDPANPLWVNWVDTPGNAVGVAVSQGYAYVADKVSGLQIIDIDPPGSAYIVNTVDTPDWALGVAVSSGYAYIADNMSGLQIIDVDPPESSYIVNMLDIPYAKQVAVSGNYAYAVDENYGDPDHSRLYVINIQQSESAYIINAVDMPYQALKVAASGGYAYVNVIDYGLQIVDVDPPESAYIVNAVDTPNYPDGLAVSNGYAYVAIRDSELQIIDIEPPESASMVKSVATHGAGAVAVSGGYAYVADSDTGLQIIDIDPLESAHIVGLFESCTSARPVALSGNYACVAGGDLHVIDIETPESASVVKVVDTPGCGALTVSDGYAYILDGLGFEVIDIEPLDSAYIVSTFYIPYATYGVAVWDGYAYFTLFWDDPGLYYIDIDPPDELDFAQLVDNIGSAYGVTALDGYAYVASSALGLVIVDVDPPKYAHIVNSVETSSSTKGVAVSGGYAYVADWNSGLQIIDIEPADSAYIVKSVDTPGNAWDVAVSGGYAYVADGWTGGLQIVDIDPPESAHIISYIDTPENAAGVAVSGNYAYVGADYGGLRIIKLW